MAMLATSCAKTYPAEVRFVAKCGNCDVEYSDGSGGTTTVHLAPPVAELERKVLMEEGDKVYLRVRGQDTLTHIPPLGWIFVGNNPIAIASGGTGNSTLETQTITTTVNGQPFTFERYWRTVVVDSEIPKR